ncbi:uncharacterized protein FIBRA_00629 [Fibroporia radiculosa]|uniref:G-protein coupled receptors family 1 profile domain-containing protein n=1 Tax=Fibroporia radiculosa TaxID=599839 RepID=J4HRX4_9APHY|nr:uncharacterized protein FIBRA_00629 [Fibroporia radiculosa]CCL98627.1 predicted protein [Fibroporia radiculosa]
MGANFRTDESFIVAGWVESALWGVYTVLYGLTLRIIGRKGWGSSNKVTLGAITLLYSLATAHNVMSLQILINAFITYIQEPGPIVYLSEIAVLLNVARDMVYITTIVIGDSVLVWRLYVVWGKNIWIAIFPLCMILATAITGYVAIGQWLNPALQSTNINMAVFNDSVRWVTAMYAVSLSTNVSVTAITAGRIWWVSYRGRKIASATSGARYTRVIILLLESGAMLAAMKIMEFILFEIAGTGIGGDNALWIVLEAMPQAMGIMPTLIVLAVTSGYTRNDDFYKAKTSVVSISMRFASEHPTMPSLVNVYDQ